jgi:hypothetical protein
MHESRTAGVSIVDSDALERIGKIEGDDWVRQQHSQTGPYSFNSLKNAWDEAVRLHSEYPDSTLRELAQDVSCPNRNST